MTQFGSDPSPHQIRMVSHGGIKLECLDWGGEGDALLFPAGLGSSAHCFDNLALKFTDKFRVLAMTRRGLGHSDKPATEYDMPTLIEDVRQCLDDLGIKRVTLVGHSFGCTEAATFAQLYPNRVIKLVYLDGAYESSPEREAIIREAGPLCPLPHRSRLPPTRVSMFGSRPMSWDGMRLPKQIFTTCWSKLQPDFRELRRPPYFTP